MDLVHHSAAAGKAVPDFLCAQASGRNGHHHSAACRMPSRPVFLRRSIASAIVSLSPQGKWQHNRQPVQKRQKRGGGGGGGGMWDIMLELLEGVMFAAKA